VENQDEKHNALTILVNAASEAQKRGAFNLEEAAVIFNAIKVFQEPPTEQAASPQLAEVVPAKKQSKKKTVR
jgi:hypothetical protein